MLSLIVSKTFCAAFVVGLVVPARLADSSFDSFFTILNHLMVINGVIRILVSFGADSNS